LTKPKKDRTLGLSKRGRKFAVTIAVIALAQANLIAGIIGEYTWREVVLGVALVFVGGTVAQKWSENKTGVTHSRENGLPPPTPPDVEA
jgi:hypothetical protein